MIFSRNYLCFVIITTLTVISQSNADNLNHAEGNTEARLLLTPFIENGNIEVAKSRARVRHKEMFNIESYSGFLTVNKKYNSNLFFWFFPALVNPKTAPVLLWLQGGPGSTSLLGLFIENGPFVVTQNITLKLRDYSWAYNHNVIYMDNPVGTGYSFCDDEAGYSENSEEIGANLYTAMTQFFQLFPELQANDFYVTGESFGGKHVPSLAYVIHQKNPSAQVKMNLKGISIGNGLTDPINQIGYGDYLYQIGLIDFNGRDQFHAYEKKYTDLLKEERYLEALDVLDKMMMGMHNGPSLFYNLTGFNFYYNYLYTKESAEPQWMGQFMNRNDVKRAVHVGNSSFKRANMKVIFHLRNDMPQSLAKKMAILMENYRVLIYSGQLDIVVAFPLTENYLRHLVWSGADKYERAARKIWKVDGEIAGYTKTADKMTEVLVRNAGHMAPADQPKWLFNLITRLTAGDSFN